MAKVQTIKFRDFMDGTWREQKNEVQKVIDALIKAGCIVPLALTPKTVLAAEISNSASQFVAGSTLQILSHALDPIVQILVAVSLPVASIVMIGGCFFFMFGNSDRAWNTIQNAGLGYILVQLSPLFIKVLEQVGKSL